LAYYSPGLRPTLVFVTITTAILRWEFRAGLCDYWWWSVEYQFAGLLHLRAGFAQFDFGYEQLQQQLLAIALLLVYLQLRTWGEES